MMAFVRRWNLGPRTRRSRFPLALARKENAEVVGLPRRFDSFGRSVVPKERGWVIV